MAAAETIDEKRVPSFTESKGEDEGLGQVVDWTEEEEKKLVRKIDLVIMSLLVIGFFSLQLDRGNIGNALIDYFLEDVGITQDQFNALQLGIVLLEIPSNLVLYKVGPTLWIGCQILAWEFVATFQAFQKGLASYLITRVLLGVCESAFIPAGMYTMTRWYKKDETSKRFSIYHLGNYASAAASGLIAYGILHMRGVCGLTGWQWLFIEHKHTTIKKKEILDTTILPHFIAALTAMAPATIFVGYAPSLVYSYGYDRLKSNALITIGVWLLLCTTVAWGYSADRLGRRGPMVTSGLVILWGLTLGNRILARSTNRDLKFALLTLGITFNANWNPVNTSWAALNAKSAGERSITIALMNDKPLHVKGWTAILVVVSVGLVASVFANVQYFFLNRRQKSIGGRTYHP
ncbi:major facilitator superfamily domain-containing protein [Pseudoneurospora amorphoporcata]|uniref:Major facilitator superfamily domain-containing protein n=1 Tax=Pseudoneurospora amorphoporcata TaxID=241081 RepID=A0AAN6NUX4_9PEZI|nr:major facilitator superfamily domain-containing protein [Pseudoneurospora amorphoporcata]